MRGACPAFHRNCNNCHKKGHFTNVCMSINKSINYLDNQKTQPTRAEEALDEDNLFIGAIFDISNEVKANNQQIKTIANETDAEWLVKLSTNRTNICYKINSGAQVNVVPENQNKHRKPIITKSTNLSAYNGSNILVKGQFTLDIQHYGKNILLLFIAAGRDSSPIIGLNSLKKKKNSKTLHGRTCR